MTSSKDSTGYELILNACEGVLQIALTENEKLLCFEEWHASHSASEILADALVEIFRRTGINAGYLRRIGCFAGPGSFTGIRLVLATAAGLRRVSKAQLASLDYLQALACTAVMNRGVLYPASLAVMTHARRDLVHFQRFKSYGPQIPPVAESEAILEEPQTALLSLAGTGAIVCGSGLARNPDIFVLPVTGKGPTAAPDVILLPELVTPGVRALCLLARHGDYFPRDVEPKYTRGCEAVENLEKSQTGSEKLNMVRELMQKQPKSEI